MKQLFLAMLALLARLCARRDAGRLERVLVIKPDHLGDLLLASPALAALRQQLPDARIVALVGPWSRRIWQGNPQLDALIELPFPGFERGTARPRRLSPARRMRQLLRPYFMLLRYGLLLRRERYDAALLLRDDHWWGAALAALAGIPRRVGHAHPLCRPFLTQALPYDPHEHVTRQALAVVAAASQSAVEAGRPHEIAPPRAADRSPKLPFTTAFVPTPDERAWADEWVSEQLAPGERLLVLHPGTGGPTKHWLPGRWAAVSDELAAVPGVRLLLTGGPGEEGLVEAIAGLMQQPSMTLAGRTSVGQLAALLAHAALMLGVDSGPLHLAVSQGVPSVHLFGPSDHVRFGPWGEPARHRVLRAGLFCSPCGVFAACPRGTIGPECMAAIGVDEVLAAAGQLLGAAGPASRSSA